MPQSSLAQPMSTPSQMSSLKELLKSWEMKVVTWEEKVTRRKCRWETITFEGIELLGYVWDGYLFHIYLFIIFYSHLINTFQPKTLPSVLQQGFVPYCLCGGEVAHHLISYYWVGHISFLNSIFIKEKIIRGSWSYLLTTLRINLHTFNWNE